MSKYVKNSDIKTITPLTPFDVECLANLQTEMYGRIKDLPIDDLYLTKNEYGIVGIVSEDVLFSGYTKL